MTPTGSSHEFAQVTDKRRHRRVNVRLGVALMLGRDAVFGARTCDMSEGGMLLDHYRGPALAPGRLVGLNMKGVISDAGAEHAGRYLMRVVRQADDLLALRFSTETA